MCYENAMRIVPRHRLFAIALTLVLGVAVLLSSYAHKIPVTQDIALASYMMAGGDLGDICDNDGNAKMTQKSCDACRLVGAAVLPDPVMKMIAVERVIAATVLIPSEVRATRAPRDPALGGRAPPLA